MMVKFLLAIWFVVLVTSPLESAADFQTQFLALFVYQACIHVQLKILIYY